MFFRHTKLALCTFFSYMRTCKSFSIISFGSMSKRSMSGTLSESMGTNNKRGEVMMMGTRMMMDTRYQVKTDKQNKLIHISFDELDDTTINYPPAKEKDNDTTQNISNEDKDTSSNDTLDICTIRQLPDSVLQYERQMRKIRAADRASKTNVNPEDHLHIIHKDDDIVVTNKPSGILCVPGVNKNRSLLDLVFEMNNGDEDSEERSSEDKLAKDSMIVHRLDMDTSGIVIFAKTRLAMSELHKAFRERTGTKKTYEALLVGWLDINKWIESQDDDNTNKVIEEIGSDATNLGGGEINLPLQRDHRHPPFMRVSTPESESEAQLAVKDLNSAGYKKLMAKKPKASTTQFRILSHEHWKGYPVTRVELTPITGRKVRVSIL